MVAFDVYDHSKKVKEKVDLADSVFSTEVNEFFLHQVLTSYEANKRQGNHKTKNRNEVHGTKSKPFRQKGTGRARQGTLVGPHQRHGARQFGPVPRSYRQSIPRKMKQEAFRQCLSLQNTRGKLSVLTDLQFNDMKTKQASALLNAFEVGGRVLLIDVNPQDNALLSVRNISKTSLLPVSSCSPLDIFQSDYVLLTKAAAELYQQRYSREGGSAE
ncbi:MAG: 50S ribosomal protein L4 [Candidatus Hinthialibacter antarcticus]|nr:50S ribosomal protein L4 [Candidatus Hinthialibacter antarcticus]